MTHVKAPIRKFVFKENGKDNFLDDPNPMLPPMAVLNHYAGLHPILTAAYPEDGEIENDTIVIRFQTTIGTKG